MYFSGEVGIVLREAITNIDVITGRGHNLRGSEGLEVNPNRVLDKPFLYCWLCQKVWGDILLNERLQQGSPPRGVDVSSANPVQRLVQEPIHNGSRISKGNLTGLPFCIYALQFSENTLGEWPESGSQD